jgi:lipopolysaccharide export LptBFGC system permease protein LptF
MKNHFIQDSFYFCLLAMPAFILVALTSCVSVKIPFAPVSKAEKAVAQKPNANFKALASSTADEAWISQKTGNTISYLSECKKADEKIEDVALETTEAIDKAKILKVTKGQIDSHRTSEVLVLGKIENRNVKMALAVFRDRDCIFSLTYGGLEENFDEEYNDFQIFKNGFKIP